MRLAVKEIILGAIPSLFLAFVVSTAFAQAAVLSNGLAINTAGAPGTEAPAVPAPIGKMSSDWMSHEDIALISHEPTVSVPTENQIQAEEGVRLEENQLVRNLVLARTQSHDVDAAARNQWLGTISLARGDRAMAQNYFHRAEEDLQTDKAPSRHVDAQGLGEDPDAANLHPNTDTAAAY
jgi:hypothetical protein